LGFEQVMLEECHNQKGIARMRKTVILLAKVMDDLRGKVAGWVRTRSRSPPSAVVLSKNFGVFMNEC